MTAKEYLRQAYRLDQKINSDLEEVAALREMASSVSSPQLSERVQTSRKGDAPFVRCLEKIIELEDKINKEIDLLVELKKEIRTVITTVEDTDERMVLKYRYESTAARGAAGKPHHCVNAPEMSRFVLRCPGAHYDIVKSAKCS